MGKNKLLHINDPKGTVSQIKTKIGKIKAVLEWDPNYASRMSNALQQVQVELDNEIIKLLSPYVPLRTGVLEKSAEIATDIGSGEIIHATPYASYQYYATSDTRKGDDPLRGGHWGDRMKADKLPQIENFVRKQVKAHVDNR